MRGGIPNAFRNRRENPHVEISFHQNRTQPVCMEKNWIFSSFAYRAINIT